MFFVTFFFFLIYFSGPMDLAISVQNRDQEKKKYVVSLLPKKGRGRGFIFVFIVVIFLRK